MKKIYLDNNYIIIEVDGLISALPIRKTLYSHIEDSDARSPAYLVYDSTIYSIEILISEVVAGDWTDENLVAWSDAALLTFLRTNTGL
jgi:hypothetical protein